jgi:hypothetical protein
MGLTIDEGAYRKRFRASQAPTTAKTASRAKSGFAGAAVKPRAAKPSRA